MWRATAAIMNEDLAQFVGSLRLMTDESIFDALYGINCIGDKELNVVDLNDKEFRALISEALVRMFDSVLF